MRPMPPVESRAGLVRVVWLAFGAILVQTLFFVPKLSWDLAVGSPAYGTLLGFAVAFAALATIWRFSESIGAVVARMADATLRVPRFHWLAGMLVLGIALRFGWAVFFPPQQMSDHGTYSLLAWKLVNGEPYFTGGTYSYWPPGYPFFLVPFYALFGPGGWAIALANCVLYAGTLLVTHRLALRFSDEGAARIATGLLAVWPNLVVSASVAQKELLLGLLVPLALLVYLRGFRSGAASAGSSLATGVLLGAASLTQPSLMLLPGILAVHGLLRRQRITALVGSLVAVGIGMAIVISPWTVRNHTVLGVWVPITTTGGDNFYSANNGLATGGYIDKYERDLSPFGEVEASRKGYEWGREWIKSHPVEFLGLVLKKQMLLMGDDSGGVYSAVKLGMKVADKRYVLLKAFANFFWIGVVLLMLCGVWRHYRSELAESADRALLVLPLLYIYIIDSVFQSGSRHHVPLAALFAVLAALAGYRALAAKSTAVAAAQG